MIATLIALLSGTIGKVLAVLGPAILALWGGHRIAAKTAENKALKENIATRERIDHAEITGADPDAARRWLHERGK